MFIKQIVIEGVEGDVEIRRTERGAVVIANDVEIEVTRDDSREERYAIAWNATNSMIHDVLNEIERVAGC